MNASTLSPSVSWRAVYTPDKFDSASGDLRVIDATTTEHPQGPLTLATINLRAFAPHIEHALDIARVMANAPQLLNACHVALEHLSCMSVSHSATPRKDCDCCTCEAGRLVLRAIRDATAAEIAA